MTDIGLQGVELSLTERMLFHMLHSNRMSQSVLIVVFPCYAVLLADRSPFFLGYHTQPRGRPPEIGAPQVKGSGSRLLGPSIEGEADITRCRNQLQSSPFR